MKRLSIVGGILVFALVAAVTTRTVVANDEEAVVVVHWANSHPMRKGQGLLPEMAARFNAEDHETASGQPIEVLVVSCDSSDQIHDLEKRLDGANLDDGCQGDDGQPAPQPTIVTPQSDDWLVDLNHQAGRDVVDLASTKTIAETYLGIVTRAAMATCLGAPDKPFGYAKLMAMQADPRGWQAYAPCAKYEWGTDPLLAFTNPNTSTSGRNVLVSLYAMATGKSPADMTLEDVERPEVKALVQEFQHLVDHYMPGTIPLNTKIAAGIDEGHFFLMPEDNLVSLSEGHEKAIAADGTAKDVPSVDDLVMIYPEEGSVLNSNPAGLVDADWVTAAQVEGAEEWLSELRDEDHQRAFMAAGFRPAAGTGVKADQRQRAQMERWGLDADPPAKTIKPRDLKPDVLDQIIGSWGSVKKPSIVTLVVDRSTSMRDDDKLTQVQVGLRRLLDAMSGSDSAGGNSQVGLVSFSDSVDDPTIDPAPIQDAGYALSHAIGALKADGSTNLFDAIARAVKITDNAPGDDAATRAVVVLSDGAATTGGRLDDLVRMRSTAKTEDEIAEFSGLTDGAGRLDQPIDARGNKVDVADVTGVALRLPHKHDVKIFFVGFGDADIQIGRILGDATRAQYSFTGSTKEDLATVIEALSGYF